MDDLISRKAVIDKAITIPIAKIVTEDKVIYRRIVFVEDIENLPSVQPEREKGEWLPAFNGCLTSGTYWFKCSKCGRIVPDIRAGGWNFCSNCGKDMRAERRHDE